MSHQVNDNWLERAGEMKSEWEGTDLELAIDKAIADGDLKRLSYLILQAEAELSRQEFYNHDAL
jgi:hypothetical protein